MPELRKDPIVGRWVIISTDRAKRPTDFARDGVKLKGRFLPVLLREREQNAAGNTGLSSEPEWGASAAARYAGMDGASGS